MLAKEHCRFAIGIVTFPDKKAEAIEKVLKDEFPEIRFRFKILEELFFLTNKKGRGPKL